MSRVLRRRAPLAACALLLLSAVVAPAALARTTGGTSAVEGPTEPDIRGDESDPREEGSLGTRTLRRGSRGPDVRRLQSALDRLGIDTGVDGRFGRGTEASVRRWERRENLPVDGVVTRSEGKRLAREASTLEEPPPPADPGGAAGAYRFPVRGKHSYGTAENRFGAGRGGRAHQGHDVMAASGTPLVAVTDGTVTVNASGGGAGNHLVIQGDDGFDYVYMHMQAPATVQKGARVRAGEPVGRVGCTGSCTAPHLHFEIWSGHRQDGGEPIDPLPKLKEWDRTS